MASHLYDIEKIERYLSHQMEGEERAAYEERLAGEEGLHREVAAYRQLLGSLAAAEGQEWMSKMDNWEAELESNDEAELIEWYLKGELSEAGQQAVEEKMAREPAFAKEVASYRQLYDSFEAASSEAFRQKTEQWEPKRRPNLRPQFIRLAAAAAVFLLLIGIGGNWYLQRNYNDTAIAQEYYRAPLTENTLGEGQPSQSDIDRQFQEANTLFKNEEYQAAYQAFDALLSQLPDAQLDDFNRAYYRDQAEWSRLLAALAMENPPIDVLKECERIASSIGHEYQLEAVGLQQKLQSRWYEWVN